MTIASGTRADVPSTTAPWMAANRFQSQEAASSANPSSSAQPRRMRICTPGSPLPDSGRAFGQVIGFQFKLLNSGLDVRDGSDRLFHRRSERLVGLPWPSLFLELPAADSVSTLALGSDSRRIQREFVPPPDIIPIDATGTGLPSSSSEATSVFRHIPAAGDPT